MGADSWLGVELRHFLALEAVPREGSFGKAATALGYTQSAVSQQIATLERIVGHRLIERPGGPKPVSLTEAGDLLLTHAGAISARIAAAQADLTALAEGQAGTLRVGVFQSVGQRILPEVMRRFVADWPQVTVTLTESADDLVHNAKAVPLTDQVRIDREEIYDILDQMRATIPEEIKQARWIVKERQEMLAEAKRETDRLLGEAREQAVREASQTEIVKIAERQAQDIVDDARRQARETRLEMEDWADSILYTLEVNLEKFLTAVKRGRERLHERSQETVMAGVAVTPGTSNEQPYDET